MTIAVHIRFSDNTDAPQHNFNYHCFTVLAGKYPEHHFIFIFDKAFDASLIIKKNITPVLLSPQIKNRLLGYYWYNFKIPALLNKYNADIFIADGLNTSLRAAAKQCMIVSDVSFLQKENLFARNELRHLKKYFKKFVSKTNCIAVTTEQIKNELAKFFPQAKEKVHIIGYGSDSPGKHPGYNEIETIKAKYSEGKEYFLAYITDVSAANTILLLKAFSAFKKRQLSNMQLLLSITSAQKEEPVKDLATYKYRNEVKIISAPGKQTEAAITTAAYAAIYLPSMDVLEDKGMLAIKNDVPLVTTDNEFNKSLYGKSALYTVADEKNIAQYMMLVYKDENLRNEHIIEGKTMASNFTWDMTAANLWLALQAAAEQ